MARPRTYTQYTAVRLPADVKADLQKLAEARGTSLSAVIIELLRDRAPRELATDGIPISPSTVRRVTGGAYSNTYKQALVSVFEQAVETAFQDAARFVGEGVAVGK